MPRHPGQSWREVLDANEQRILEQGTVRSAQRPGWNRSPTISRHMTRSWSASPPSDTSSSAGLMTPASRCRCSRVRRPRGCRHCRNACKWWYAGFHWAPEGTLRDLLTRITSSWTVNSPLAASPLDTGACASHQRLYLGETGRLIGGWARTGRSRLGSAAKRDRAQAVGGCCCRVEPDGFSGSAQPATLTARSDCRVPGVST